MDDSLAILAIGMFLGFVMLGLFIHFGSVLNDDLSRNPKNFCENGYEWECSQTGLCMCIEEDKCDGLEEINHYQHGGRSEICFNNLWDARKHCDYYGLDVTISNRGSGGVFWCRDNSEVFPLSGKR